MSDAEREHLARIERDYHRREAEKKAKKRKEQLKRREQELALIEREQRLRGREQRARGGGIGKLSLYGKDMMLGGSSKSKGKQTVKRGKQKFVIKDGVAYPVHQKKRSQKKKKSSSGFNWDDCGMPSWEELMK